MMNFSASREGGRFTILLLGLSILLTSSALAQQPAQHALFQKMIGQWTAEGKITLPDNEQGVEITENWTGKFDDEGRLVIDGSRTVGDTEQTFRWIYFFNATQEWYEVLYRDSSSDEEKSFQVSVQEAANRVEMQIPLGDSGATLVVRNTVTEGRVESVITVQDANGSEVGGGKIMHTRQSPPTPEGAGGKDGNKEAGQ